MSEEQNQRVGERVQRWWCKDCQCEHEAAVIGGKIETTNREEGK